VPAQPAGGWRSLRIAADTDRSFPRGTLLRLPAHLPTRSVHLAILMYHRIDQITPDLPSITRALTVSPVDFARQMGWIESHGYDTITQLQLWDALMNGRALPAHPVLVTFDDAYRDVVTYAAPVLARDHERATAYVITDRLSHGRRSPWMLWTQLRLLERDGFEIGSHTVSHADLVAVGPAEARLQLRASRSSTSSATPSSGSPIPTAASTQRSNGSRAPRATCSPSRHREDSSNTPTSPCSYTVTRSPT
jgi:peptidoglycan/xylan/chitin deacetylase (PgdA/CDA1 family)